MWNHNATRSSGAGMISRDLVFAARAAGFKSTLEYSKKLLAERHAALLARRDAYAADLGYQTFEALNAAAKAASVPLKEFIRMARLRRIAEHLAVEKVPNE